MVYLTKQAMTVTPLIGKTKTKSQVRYTLHLDWMNNQSQVSEADRLYDELKA